MCLLHAPRPRKERGRVLVCAAHRRKDPLGNRGVVLAKDHALIEKLRLMRILFGNILQPDECWMLNGRLPTVGLRMNQQSKNAQRLAEAQTREAEVRFRATPPAFKLTRNTVTSTLFTTIKYH